MWGHGYDSPRISRIINELHKHGLHGGFAGCTELHGLHGIAMMTGLTRTVENRMTCVYSLEMNKKNNFINNIIQS